MNARGHIVFTGALAGGLAAVAVPAFGPMHAAVFFSAAVAGATGPDMLEGRYFIAGGSRTLIPHRTLTHWWPLWVAAMCVGIYVIWASQYGSVLPVVAEPGLVAMVGVGIVGFSFGGLTHVLADAMTPMGVPVWRPFGRRRSLRLATNLWRRALVIAMALLVGWALVVAGAHAAPKEVEPGEARCLGEAECGWWWGFIDRLAEERKRRQEQEISSAPTPEETLGERCRKEETWTPDCGFVDPAGSFSFQAKQRDALFEQAVMTPNDASAVEALQYYHRWVIRQAVTMSRMWEFNMLQNTDLNPFVAAPVSAFGLRALAAAREETQRDIFADIAEQGGMLVWFTRTSCGFCHQMIATVKRVSERTGIKAWNASLEDDCMPGFENACETGESSTVPAQVLRVSVVPALFLHLPEDNVWVRVSAGIESMDTILARIENFFTAVRTATAKGMVAVNGRPPADFDQASLTRIMNQAGLAPGVTSE